MYSKVMTIINEEGFHARPAQLWVQTASRYESNIIVEKEDRTETNGKSILGLMTLELKKGTKVTIKAEGPDEKEAIEALAELVESKFGEE